MDKYPIQAYEVIFIKNNFWQNLFLKTICFVDKMIIVRLSFAKNFWRKSPLQSVHSLTKI